MKARKNNRIVAALFSLMAPRTSLTLSLAATATFVLGLQTAQAQRFWDNNGTTSGFGTAAGTWAAPTTGSATQGWSTSSAGTTLPTDYTTLTTDALNFGNTTTGLAAGTIAVSGTVSAGGITFASGSGAITLSGGTISLVAAQTTTVNNTTNTISSVISGAATSFTKAGAGNLVLSGANTYTGTTAINAGVLVAGSSGAIAGGLARGGTGAGININGGILGLGAGDFYRVPNGASSAAGQIAFVSNGGFAAFNADRVVNFNGTNSTTSGGIIAIGSTTTAVSGSMNGKELVLGASTSTHKVTVLNTLDFGSGTRTIQANDGSAAVDGEVSGVLQPQSGATGVGLIKTGTGTLALSGANTLNGPVSIRGGQLNVATIADSGPSNLGSGTSLIVGNGSASAILNYTGAGNTTARTVQIGNNSATPVVGDTGSATLQNNGTGALNFTAATFNLPTNAATGTSPARTLTLAGSNTAANSIAGVIQNNQIAGNPTAAVALTKSGTGNWVLTGTNTYTGATSVTDGALILSGSGSINTSSGITVNGSLASFMQFSSAAVTPAVTLTQGTLTGNGTLTTVNAGAGTGAVISNNNGVPGASLSIGTLNFAGAATVNTFHTAGNFAAAVATTNLSTNVAGSITLNPSASSWANGTYALLSYTGSVGGAGSTQFVLGTVSGLSGRQSASALADTGSALAITISGDTPKWTGADDGTWQVGTTGVNENWKLVTAGTPTSFLANDLALFDDTASGVTAININAANVSPFSAIFNHSTKNYTLTSSGGFGISGGTLTKSGTGTLTILNRNTSSGATVINGGVLDVSTDGAQLYNSATAINSSVTVTNGGVLVVRQFGQGSTSGTGSPSLGNLNNSGGQVIIDGGTLRFNNETTSRGRVINIGSNGATLDVVNNTNYTWTTSPGTVVPFTGSGQTLTLTGDSTSAGRINLVIAGTGVSIVKNGAATWTLAGANSYSGTTAINAGTLRIGAVTSLGAGTSASDGTTVSAGATLDLGGVLGIIGTERITASGAGVGGLGAITSSTAIATPFIGVRHLTLAGETTLGFSNRWDVGDNTAGDIDALIGGGNTLNVLGTATAAQASLNFLGETDLGDINVNLGNTATNIFYIQGSTTLGRAANTMSISGGTAFEVFTNSTLTTIDKKFDLNNATLRINRANAMSLPGTIKLTGAGTITANIASTAITASGEISGNGTLTKAGTGTLILTGANPYTGATAITAGGLAVSVDGALGTIAGNTTVSANAALGFSGGVNYATAEAVIGSGAGNTTAAGVFAVTQRGFVQSVSGNNTFAGAVQINATGTSRIGTQTGAQLTLSGPVTMASGTTGVTVLFRTGDTDGDFVTLSNAGNSWDTATQIFNANAGTGAGVRLGINNGLPTGIPILTFAGTGAGTMFDLAGFNQEVNGLAHGSNGVLIISNSHASNTSVLTLNTTADRDFGTGGVIANGATAAVQLVKTGAFSQTLRTVNTYTGTTTVNAGALTIAGAGALTGTTGLTVANGGTFNYLPTTVGTSLTLGAASTLNLNNGSTIGLNWDATTSSRIVALGAATIGTGTGVSISMTGTPTMGTPYTILSAASGLDVGNFTLLNPTDYTLSINQTATDVIITPVAATPLTTAYWKGGFAGSTGVWSVSNGLTGGSGLSNWTTDAAGTANTALVPGAGTNVFFSAAGAGAADQNTMTLGANMAVNSLTVNDASAPNTNPVTLLGAGGYSLTVAGSSGTGMTVNSGSGAVTLGVNLVLGADQSWTNNSAQAVTALGNVSGNFALTKAGTGLVNIQGSAGLSALTVSAGNFYLGAATGASTTTTLGAGVPVTLTGTSNLTIRRTDTTLLDFAGVISGGGSLSLIGDNPNVPTSGNFTINDDNSYSGGTTITASRAGAGHANAFGTGTVTVGASAGIFFSASGLSVANNFVIGGQGWLEPSGLLGALRLNSTTLSGTVTLTSNTRIAGSGSSFIDGKISGSFGLDFFEDTSFGTITLSGANDYTGETIVNSMGSSATFPNLVVANNSALGTTAAGTTVFGTGTTGTGSLLSLASGITVTDETLTLDATASGYRASLSTSTDAESTWDGNVILTGAASTIGFAANGLSSKLTIGATTADTITGTNDLTLGGTGSGTINSAITLGTNRIVKNDAGTWTIVSNNNAFSGIPSIAGGVLRVSTLEDAGVICALGTGTGISLGQNAAAAGRLQFAGSTGGSSNRALIVANGATGGSGAIENTVAGQTLTLSGDITTLTPASASTLSLLGAGNGALTGSITGSPALALVKDGAGTWTLAGSNTHTGTTTVTDGSLIITGSRASAAGGTTSRLLVGATSGLTGALTIGSSAGVINFGGDAYTNAVQIGINGGTGSVTMNGGTVSLVGTNGTTAASLNIGVQVTAPNPGTGLVTVNNGTLNVGQRILLGANNLASSGTLTITGGTVDVGTNGTLGYTGANPGVVFLGTGAATVNLDGGTLNVFGFKSHGSGTATINFNGGTLVAKGTPSFFMGNNGGSDTAPTATGVYNTVVKSGGAILNTNGFSITIPSAMVADPSSTGGGLTKNGAGTLTLNGANTYTGNTLVNAGALTLAAGAQLRFVLGATSGSNNSISGAGTVTLNGNFFIDTTAADALASGTWTLENVPSLTGAYGTTFSVVGFTDAGSDKWTKTVGAKKYTFDETTGVLTLETLGYASWATVNGAGANLNDDHDTDGVPNGVEYFLGGPAGNTTGFTALPGVTNTAGTLSVTWVMGSGYAGVYNTHFTVETSDTLTGTWTTESSPGTVSISGSNVKYTFPTPLGSKRFARLKVTGP